MASQLKPFTWCRQEIAEFCLVTEDHTHVAIRSPEGKTIVPRCHKETLHLSFLDLEPELIRKTEAYRKDSKRGEELCAACFKEGHAQQIVEFLAKHHNDNLVVVNCEAGISRSAGVVLALRKKYGGDMEEIYKKAVPNTHVASIMGIRLGIGAFERRIYDLKDGFF